MARKLTGVFLAGAMCMLVATSGLAMEYKEAPELKEKVARGGASTCGEKTS